MLESGVVKSVDTTVNLATVNIGLIHICCVVAAINVHTAFNFSLLYPCISLVYGVISHFGYYYTRCGFKFAGLVLMLFMLERSLRAAEGGGPDR